MWDIVSFGDVKTLNMVFNAIAAIFSDGGYKAAGYALAIMVVVGMSLSSLATGKQELPFPRMLAAFIVFSFGFMTLTKVSIENRYDGTVTQIDNIPVAVAVPASLISQIGLYLVEAGETAFGDTGANRVSANGYLSPLSIIASYRTASMIDNCPAGEANSTGGGINLCYTLRQYYSECTSIKATRQNAYLAIREGNALQSMQYSSNAYTTKVVKSDGSSEIMNCSTAYDLIANAMNGSTFEQMIAANNIPAGVRLGEDGFTRTTDALEAIGLDGGKNRSFLQALYLRKAAEDGTLAFLHRTGAADMAENLQSSIEQRNYAWTMQGELWTQIVDKFIAIIECLIYALAPFIGLMVLVGTIGAKTVMLYLQMLAIIQLIPVMLVITQNIIMADMESYATMLAAKYDVGSLAFTEQLTDKAKELMGLGGMLASTVVPALAMALVTGSGMAVMGAFRQVGAPAKDVDATPDMAGQGGAVTNLGQMNTGNKDEYGNVMTQRTETAAGKLATSSSVGNSINSAYQEMNTAQSMYSQSLSNMQSTVDSNIKTGTDAMNFGQNISSSIGEAKSLESSIAKDINKQYSIGESRSEKIAAAITGAASASAGLEVFGSGVTTTMQGEIKGSATSDLTGEDKKIFNELTSGKTGESINSQMTRIVQAGLTNGETISTGSSEMDSAVKQSQEARSELESTSNTYSSLSTAQQMLSSSNDDIRTNAFRLGQNEKYQELSDERIANMSDQELQHYTNTMQRLQGGSDANNMDSNTASVMAMMITDNFFGNQDKSLDMISKSLDQNSLSESDLAPVNTVNSNQQYGNLQRDNISEPIMGKDFTLDYNKLNSDIDTVNASKESNDNTVHNEKFDNKTFEEINESGQTIQSESINKPNYLSGQLDSAKQQTASALQELGNTSSNLVEDFKKEGGELNELLNGAQQNSTGKQESTEQQNGEHENPHVNIIPK